MFFLSLQSLLLSAALVTASSPSEDAVQRLRDPLRKAGGPPHTHTFLATAASNTSVAAKPSPPSQDAFRVSGSGIPLLNTTVQDSFAGRLPLSNNTGETRMYFFWYWPTSAQNGSDTLSIWLNGGPGCSSLLGFLEENGPVSWIPGTQGPVVNNNAWSTQTDMLYIDQPLNAGFSKGTPDITDETELADQFYGFLAQFYSVFPELVSKKLFITGESYAGFYIPYIANRILTASSAEKAALPLNLQSILLGDGVYSSFVVSQHAPAAAFALANQQKLGIPEAFAQSLASASSQCGYDALMAQLKYPPSSGPFALPALPIQGSQCDTFDALFGAELGVNPCFNVYRITDKCPTPTDPAPAYFSRADVQAALHIPGSGTWNECQSPTFSDDNVDDSAFSETLFPSLLSALPRGMTLWHGLDDGILLSNGSRLTIQNLTWAGAQGFQQEPSTPLVVNGQKAGVYHVERGLTYIEVLNSGHMIPQNQPEVALAVYRAFIGLDNTTLASGGAGSGGSGSGSGGGSTAGSKGSGPRRSDGPMTALLAVSIAALAWVAAA